MLDWRPETRPTDGHAPPGMIGWRAPRLVWLRLGGGCARFGALACCGWWWRRQCSARAQLAGRWRCCAPCGAAGAARRGAAAPAGATCARSGPSLIPAITTDDIAQRQHRIDMRPRPVHATALQPRLDDQFIATFNGAVTNRPAGRQERRVLHMGDALLQVGQMRRLSRPTRAGRRPSVALRPRPRPGPLCLSSCSCVFSQLCASRLPSPKLAWPTAAMCSPACGKSRMRTASARC